jgi:glucosyl-3-phosphoglycerate synthase
LWAVTELLARPVLSALRPSHGLDGLAQVNLGVRKHRNGSLLQLGVMARQILGTALGRCGIDSSDPA